MGRKMGKPNWHRLWQVPLLVAGLVAFGYGVRAWSRSVKPVPFETYVADIKGLIEGKQFDKAIVQINKVCNYYKGAQQSGTLHLLAGDAYFGAIHAPLGETEENWQQLIEHYRAAESFGVPWTTTIRERVGEAALQLGDTKLAVEQLEAVISHEPATLPEHARTLVTCYLARGSGGETSDGAGKARAMIEKVLAAKESTLDDRVWALTSQIEMALGGLHGVAALPQELDRAVEQAREAVKGIPERNPAGTLLTWIGRAEFEAGQVDKAREHLLDGRSRFVVHNLDDGRAALLLGKIAQGKGEQAEALRMFQEVITTHPGSSIYDAARLGRAEVLAARHTTGRDMEDDYLGVIKDLRASDRVDVRKRPEMVTLEHVKASLLANYQSYQKEDRLAEALRFLELYKAVGEAETAANVYREATAQERRADELLAASRVMKDAKRAAVKRSEALQAYSAAADAFLRHADLSTMDDVLFGDSLLKAGQLMDRAGRPTDALKVYERFSVQRPRDARASEVLYAMGQLHQAHSDFDQAIAAHERNRKENPKTPASYLSTVQLARCYMAKGEGTYRQAQDALLELVQDNPNLLPTANEFRIGLFTLGELYYKWSAARGADAMQLGDELLKKTDERERKEVTQKRDEAAAEALKFRASAILRLEEALERYPKDPLALRTTFWLADCYRRSAADIAGAIAKDPAIAHRDSLHKAEQDRLTQAAGFYSAVINTLGDDEATQPAAGSLEEGVPAVQLCEPRGVLFRVGAVSAGDQAV